MPSATMQMQSISGIITQIHLTSGEAPPPLVGASVTVVDDRVFVFAGRLVSSRKMTNYMYVLDLNTLQWTRHIPPPDSAKPPKPRYFHSADVHNKTIVVFGGMGYSRTSTDGLCVLDDVSVFDVETMSWRKPTVEPSLFAPRPRYAHLSTVAGDKLVVMGGQDMNNGYLGEINVLDLNAWEWVHAKSFDKHVGAYRSIAITGPPGTRLPAILKENMTKSSNEDQNGATADTTAAAGDSTTAEGEWNDPIYLYTNYNFADVKRELQLILSPGEASSAVEDCSNYMTGSAMPPGLRFPTGHTLGHHLVLAGTYLSPQTQSFSIWALDLGTLTWSRIETGSVFNTGSWNRGVLHAPSNRFVVFGHRGRNLLEDYNHRQVNFEHVAMVDMEAFGVYHLPEPTCSPLAQEMGLSLLNEPALCDFKIITNENNSIPVNSAVLANRWPYFARLMEDNRAWNLMPPPPPPPPSLTVDDEKTQQDGIVEEQPTSATLKTHAMLFPYPYHVVIALLQYLYTDNLLTAQQYQPHILSQLLLLADMYDLTRLRELATHALHQMLNMSTAPLIFETAALSHQTSLQVRALKMMIAAKKMIQQQQQQQQQQQSVSTPLSSRDGTFSMYAESTSGSSGGGGGGLPASLYSRSPSVSSSAAYQHHHHQQPPMESPMSAMFDTGNNRFPPPSSRNRTPSLPQSPPPPMRSSTAPNTPLYTDPRRPSNAAASMSPPLAPRHGGLSSAAPDNNGWSPQPSKSQRSKKEALAKDGKKSSSKENKTFKFSLNFQ
ncbi:galactose oxidase [Lichtheimia corymbifera JMRC:FSU:9682]|uniref:Galactose oxidase n=1 Tax=Lichtheimia corymbifera JMRC:FSU:9682 TaxID=1263082 RepID=A0A068SDK6_9FUNG|nr:galactose oxidase [Lichtheimia corymbifera JMRC:FSU:9682]